MIGLLMLRPASVFFLGRLLVLTYHPSIHPSFLPSVLPSIHRPTCPSTHSSVHLFIYLVNINWASSCYMTCARIYALYLQQTVGSKFFMLIFTSFYGVSHLEGTLLVLLCTHHHWKFTQETPRVDSHHSLSVPLLWHSFFFNSCDNPFSYCPFLESKELLESKDCVESSRFLSSAESHTRYIFNKYISL